MFGHATKEIFSLKLNVAGGGKYLCTRIILVATFQLKLCEDGNGDHEYLDTFVDPEYDRASVGITITILI